MKITPEQRKALEAKGYKVGKSGNTIQNAKGATVGGYNANGQIFSGSADIKSILKSKAEAPKASAPSRPRASTRSAPPKPAPKGGRGDGNYERIVRGADAAITRAQAASNRPPSVMSEAPKQSKPPASQPPIVRAGTPAKPKPAAPKPAAPKPSARPPQNFRSGPMNNPVSRGASSLGRKIGEFFNGKPKRKPVRLNPKDNKHPLD